MADSKVSAFPPSAGLVLTDIFPVIDDPGGTPAEQKATFAQLQTLLSAGMVSSFNTRVGAVTLLLADVTALVDSRYVLKTGDTMTGALAIGNGTLVASAPVLSLSQTWNNAAVTFTNLLSNVTNTASNANSNLFNFQVDGVDRFNFTVGGTLRAVRQTADDSGLGFFLRKRGATGDINGAIANGAVIGNLFFSGWDGAAFATGGRLTVSSTSLWTAANHGTMLDFFAVENGGLTDVRALTITAASLIVRTSIILPYVAKVATYTATAADYTIDGTSGTFDVDLPTAVGIPGRIYAVKNSGVGTITIDPDGAELIDGAATATIIAGASLTVQSTGAGWIII